LNIFYDDNCPSLPNLKLCRENEVDINLQTHCSLNESICTGRCYTPHNLSISIKTASTLLLDGKADPVIFFVDSFGITVIDADFNGSSTLPAAEVSSPYFSNTKITLSTVSQQIVFSSVFTLSTFILNSVDQSQLTIGVQYVDLSMGTLTRLARKATTGDISLLDISAITIGNPLHLMVADWDANKDPYTADTITVFVASNVEQSAPEPLIMLENDLDSGVFTGFLNTSEGSQAKQDQVLQVSLPLSCAETAALQVTYQDKIKVDGNQGTISKSIPYTFDSRVSISSFLALENDTLTVTLRDMKQTSEPRLNVSVKALHNASGTVFSETILELAATSSCSTTYTGSISLCVDCSSDVQRLNVGKAHLRKIVASFTDSLNSVKVCQEDCDTLGACALRCTNSDTVESPASYVSERGTLTTEPFMAKVDNFNITLQDVDADKIPSVRSLVLQLSYFHYGFYQSFCDTTAQLQESDSVLGIFNALVDIRSNLAGSTCKLSSRDRIQVSYNDYIPAAQVVDLVYLYCNAIITQRQTVNLNSMLGITVQDCDMDITANVDAIEVVVRSFDRQQTLMDSKTIILYETSSSSALQATFTGAILLSDVYNASSNNVLFASNETESITSSYVDLLTSSPPSNVSRVARTFICTGLSMNAANVVGGRTIVNEQFSSSGLLNIAITDLTARASQIFNPRVVQARLEGALGTDMELVYLQESDAAQGTFTGSIVLSAGVPFAHYDHVLGPAHPSDRLFLTTADECDGVHNLSLSCIQIGQIVAPSFAPVAPGSELTVVVVDADLNSNSSSSEVWPNLLRVTDLLSGEAVVLDLVENGTDSKSFLASLTVSRSPCNRSGCLAYSCRASSLCELKVEYTDSAYGPVDKFVPIATFAVLEWSTSAGQNQDVVLAGEELNITLLDADAAAAAAFIVLRCRAFEERINLKPAGHSGNFTIPIDTNELFKKIALSNGESMEFLSPFNVSIEYQDMNPLLLVTKSMNLQQLGLLFFEKKPLVWNDVISAKKFAVTFYGGLGLQLNEALVVAEAFSNVGQDLHYAESRLQVYLNKTDEARNIFSGFINCSNQTSDYPLFVQMNSRIILTVEDSRLPSPSRPRNETRFASDACPHSSDCPHVLPEHVGAGATLTITVVDSDADRDFEQVDTVSVVVQSSRILEGTEEVVLKETVQVSTNLTSSEGQGIFTGLLSTRQDSGYSAQNDGVMFVNEGEILSMSYREVSTFSGEFSVHVSEKTVGAGGNVGTIAFQPRVIMQDGSFCLSVHDQDLIFDNQQTVQVTLSWSYLSSNENHQVNLEMYNNTASDRYHRACFYLKNSSNETGITFIGNSTYFLWNLEVGEIISATYFDTLPALSHQAITIVSARGQLTASPLVAGLNRRIYITLTDEDLNMNPSLVENASVLVTSSWAGEGEGSVVLTETGTSSSTFTGFIRIILSGVHSPELCGDPECQEPLANLQVLHVREGDILTLTYTDKSRLQVLQDAANDVVVNVTIGVTGQATMSSLTGDGGIGNVLKAKEKLLVTVVDPDNSFLHLQKIAVVVSTDKDGEVETVYLYPTSLHSPEYVGTLETCMGDGICSQSSCGKCDPNVQGVSNDGNMTVRPGDQLTVTYNDAMPVGDRTGTIKVAKAGIMSIKPSYDVFPGDNISFLVVDNDANTNPNLAETVDVFINSLDVEIKTLKLTEISKDSNHFTGILQTCLACRSQLSSVLVSYGGKLKLQYVDKNMPFATSVQPTLTLEVSSLARISTSVKSIFPNASLEIILYNSETRLTSDSLVLEVTKYPSSDAETEEVTVYQQVVYATVIQILRVNTALLSAANVTGESGIYINGLMQVNSNTFRITSYDFATKEFVVDTINAGFVNGMVVKISNYGVYQGGLQTRLHTGDMSISGDHVLEVEPGQDIVISFYDNSPFKTVQQTVKVASAYFLRANLIEQDNLPVLEVVAQNFFVNSPLQLNEDLYVTISSSDGNQVEVVKMVPSSDTPGQFFSYTQLDPTSTVLSNDGLIQYRRGELFNVSYVSLSGLQSVMVSKFVFYPARLQVLPTFALNDSVFITVFDADLNLDDTKVDIWPNLTSAKVGDVETILLLQETDVASGIFTTSLLTAENSTVSQDRSRPSAILMPLLSTVVVSYMEENPRRNVSTNTTAHNLGRLSIAIAADPQTNATSLLVELVDRDAPEGEVGVLLATADFQQQLLLQPSDQLGRFSRFLPVSDVRTGTLAPLTLRHGETLQLQYADSLPSQHVQCSFSAPTPQFVSPSPPDGSLLLTAELCHIDIPLVASEDNSFSILLVPTAYWIIPESSSSSWTNVTVSSSVPPLGKLVPGGNLRPMSYGVRSLCEGELCPAVEGCASSSQVSIVSSTFSWTPGRSHRGHELVQCFAMMEAHGATVSPQRCLRFLVQLCFTCTVTNDSLNSIATAMWMEWQLLWSINPTLRNFDVIRTGEVLKIGILYTASREDTIESLSHKFTMNISQVIMANPHLNATGLAPGDIICIFPSLSAYDACPPQPKSSTWEPLAQQYIPPDYWDNPYNWEIINFSDPRGLPSKQPNPNYPQRPTV